MWTKRQDIRSCPPEEYGLFCTGFTKLYTSQLYYGNSLYKMLLKLDEKCRKYGKNFNLLH